MLHLNWVPHLGYLLVEGLVYHLVHYLVAKWVRLARYLVANLV